MQHPRGRREKRKQNNFKTNLTITPVPFDLFPTQITPQLVPRLEHASGCFGRENSALELRVKGTLEETGELLDESQGREAALNSSNRDRSRGFAALFPRGLDGEREW